MPSYSYSCTACAVRFRRFRTPEAAAKSDPKCPACGAAAARDPSGATSKVVETLDNGAMRKVVERPADVERLNWERAHPDGVGTIR